MEERYHATTQNRFYPDMSNVNKDFTVEAKLISSPTYIAGIEPRCDHPWYQNISKRTLCYRPSAHLVDFSASSSSLYCCEQCCYRTFTVWIKTLLLPSSCLLKCACRSSSGWPSLTFHRSKTFSIIQITDFLLLGERSWSGTWTLEVDKVARPQAPHCTWLHCVCVGLEVKWRRSYTADPKTEWWQAFTEFTQLFICSWMKFGFAGKDK